MPENLNKNLEQKSYTECVTHENYYSAYPAHPSPLYSGPEPLTTSPLHPQKSDLDSLSKLKLQDNSK